MVMLPSCTFELPGSVRCKVPSHKQLADQRAFGLAPNMGHWAWGSKYWQAFYVFPVSLPASSANQMMMTTMMMSFCVRTAELQVSRHN